MSRLTRKELKSDKFALEVQHSVEYVSNHRQQLIRWGGIGAAVVIVIAAIFFYRSHEHGVRQEALHAAMNIQNSQIGTAPNEYVVAFATEAERQSALNKAFTELAAKYPGTDEGNIAEFFLATNAADKGNLAEAEKRLKTVIDSSNKEYGSMAKLSLAHVYAAQNKLAEGEKVLQSLIDNPTQLVSKDSATIELAQLIKNSDPQRARKMLEPLRSSPRANISRAAVTALGDLSK